MFSSLINNSNYFPVEDLINDNAQRDKENSFRFITNMAVRFFGLKAAIFSAFCDRKEYILSTYGINEEAKEIMFHTCLSVSKELIDDWIYCGKGRVASGSTNAKFGFEDSDGYFMTLQIILKDKSNRPLGNLFLIDKVNKNISVPEKQDLYLLAEQATRLLNEQIAIYELNLLNSRLLTNVKLLEEIQNSNKIGYWCLEVASGRTEWSDLIYDIYEVERDFIQSKENGLSFYHPDYVEQLKEAIDQCIMMDKPFDIQCLLITGKGNQKWVRSTGFKSGNFLYGSFQDISKIKKNELKFEAIFNTSASLIWFLDSAGLVLNFNATASEIMKVDAGEILGKHLWECPCLANLNTREVKDMLAKALNGQEVNYELEITTEVNQLFPVIFSL
ncbi:MAG: PAS domain-containing protein, partial [Crocinitomicaceae bacterium]|nr:PAS domain-containing protein [Crocinitomicaceae bacterium]